MKKDSMKQIHSNISDKYGNKRLIMRLLNYVKQMLKLSNLRHALEVKTLRSVYYVLLESHLCNAALNWAQNWNSFRRLHLLQKKQNNVLSSRNSAI